MWFFNISLAPVLIIGMVWLLFAKPIINRGLKNKPDSFFSRPTNRRIFLVVWLLRVIGVVTICSFLYMGINSPPRGMMKKDENRLVLLEKGKVIEGSVFKGWYDDWAPSAWMILYSFKTLDSANSEEKTYWGSARGPKPYYANLSKGDTVKIIYNLSNPKINCEMYTFLNDPSYRRTFREAGKKDLLLNRFRDEYEFETYSELKWFDLAREK